MCLQALAKRLLVFLYIYLCLDWLRVMKRCLFFLSTYTTCFTYTAWNFDVAHFLLLAALRRVFNNRWILNEFFSLAQFLFVFIVCGLWSNCVCVLVIVHCDVIHWTRNLRIMLWMLLFGMFGILYQDIETRVYARLCGVSNSYPSILFYEIRGSFSRFVFIKWPTQVELNQSPQI